MAGLPPLPPGPLPLNGGDVAVVAPVGRVGDGLVYAARAGGVAVRLREYAPAGIARRLPDGTLLAAEARFAGDWEEARARFLDQAARLARVDHYAVAPVVRALALEADGARQGAFLIGKPAGEPLAAALASGLVLAPADVLRVAADLADALAMLHARGITHLDICPDTVSIAAGWLELSDFAVDNRAFMSLLGTQDGLVRPGYSGIEHYDAGLADPLGPPADIHAASALLHRLIEGRAPPSWQERWRDPDAALLPDRLDYPPFFLAAVRQGLAIEPGDRFPDGAAWQAALGLPAAGKALESTVTRQRQAPPAAAIPPPAAAVPPPPLAPAASPPMPARDWLAPLLVVLAIIAIAGIVYLAYTQRWFAPAAEPAAPGNTITTPLPPRPAPRPEPAFPPLIQPGATVAGRLSASDERTGGGQFADRFTIDARGGERLDIRLGSSDFDPMLALTGPGLDTGNDDEEDADTSDSRLVVTLPAAGRYTLSVTSYERGETGAYLLQVLAATAAPEPPPEVTTLDFAVAARLSGRWAAIDDEACARPATNSVSGDRLTSSVGGVIHVHRITAANGLIVRTVATLGPASGRGFVFQLSEDGDSYLVEGETWSRC